MGYEVQAGSVGKMADAEIAGLKADLDTIRAANVSIGTALSSVQSENIALKAKIATLLPPVKHGTNFENIAVKDAAYGKGKVARVFYPKIPAKYDGPVDRLVIVSFKCSLVDLLKGVLDGALLTFLKSIPVGSIVALYHEPEDNIKSGEFTAAQFRASQSYVKSLIAKNGLDLKFALILMGWTLDPAAKRNFSDYFSPGIYDYLGWDCYNLSALGYDSPEKVLGKVLDKGVEMSLPTLICEWGSTLKGGDDGTKRAEWVTAMGAYMRDRGVKAAAYFDRLTEKNDFRLSDSASKAALRALVAS